MFSNDGFGDGGFDTSGFGSEQTPQAEKKGSVRSDRVLPVTVRQIIESPDTGIKLHASDVEIQHVKLIGIIKKINKSSLKIIYSLQDNTGTIEGIHWLEADSDDNFVVPVVDNTYCAMVGVIRNSTAQHNQKHIMVFKIYPIEDLNELTAHTLHIIYISLKAEETNQKVPTLPSKQEMASVYGDMDIGMSSTSDPFSGFNLNTNQLRVIKTLAHIGNTENGATVQDIMTALPLKMPMKDLENIVEYLVTEGHVYSTLDDKHFRATDAYTF